jgi:hypothetical protein
MEEKGEHVRKLPASVQLEKNYSIFKHKIVYINNDLRYEE